MVHNADLEEPDALEVTGITALLAFEHLVPDRHALQAAPLDLRNDAPGDEGVVLGKLRFDPETPLLFLRVDDQTKRRLIHLVVEEQGWHAVLFKAFLECALDDDVATEIPVAEHRGESRDDPGIVALGDGFGLEDLERDGLAVFHGVTQSGSS